MRKIPYIQFNNGVQIPILYEDRSILAIDKPAGWMLIPQSWAKTDRNLQLALQSSIRAGDFWARSRSLKYLRFIHRLDTETTGVLLLAKSPGALKAFGELFASRQMQKVYLAVAGGIPSSKQWTCDLPLRPDAKSIGKMRVDPLKGKAARTCFEVLQTRGGWALVEARPITGRTHQIRVHLAAAGCPIVGDQLYSGTDKRSLAPGGLALRAVALKYVDPFRRFPVCIQAPAEEFKKRFGFDSDPQA